MKITYDINTVATSQSGKPSFRFQCEHCLSSLDLTACMYQEMRHTGIEPEKLPKQAVQEFVWRLNAGDIPKSARKSLCYCDENPIGLVGEWFRTNSRKIEQWELDNACDQIKLYAVKDDIDPDGKDAKKAIKELKAAVKEHNNKI